MKKTILYLILVLCIWQMLMVLVQCDHYTQCDGIIGKFVASNKSCKHYIYCDTDSYEGECEDNLYFNAADVLCVEKSMANCSDSQNGNSTNTTATTTAPTTITTSTTSSPINSTVSPANNTNLTTTDIQNSSTINEFTTTTTIQTTITTTMMELNANFNNKVIVANACPSRDNLQEMVLLPHMELCSSYFLCYQGQPIEMQCAPLLHFNSQTGKCDYEQNVKCVAQNALAQCGMHTTDHLAYPSNCNYFYQCRNGYLMLRQCPFSEGWDTEKRTCVKMSEAKCLHS